MLDDEPRRSVRSGGEAELPAGERAAGRFVCTRCGYGITVRTTLPRCPMCGGELWELES